MAFSGKEFWKALKTEFKVETGVLAARITAPMAKDERPNIFGQGSLAHHKYIGLNNAFKQAGLSDEHAKIASIASTAAVIGVIDIGAVKTAGAINPKFGHAMEVATPALLASKFMNKRLLAKLFSSSGMKEAEKKYGQTVEGKETLSHMSDAVGYMERHFDMYEESRQGYRDYIHANPDAHVGHGAEALSQNNRLPELIKKASLMNKYSRVIGVSPGKKAYAQGVEITEASVHKEMMGLTSDQLMQRAAMMQHAGVGTHNVSSSVGTSAGPGARVL